MFQGKHSKILKFTVCCELARQTTSDSQNGIALTVGIFSLMKWDENQLNLINDDLKIYEIQKVLFLSISVDLFFN